MPTSRPRGLATELSSVVSVMVALSLFHSSARGQLPAFLLNEATEVRSIRFRFLDSETFSHSRLLKQIGLTERGKSHGLRKSLGFLPLISEPDPHPFDPLER